MTSKKSCDIGCYFGIFRRILSSIPHLVYHRRILSSIPPYIYHIHAKFYSYGLSSSGFMSGGFYPGYLVSKSSDWLSKKTFLIKSLYKHTFMFYTSVYYVQSQKFVVLLLFILVN